MPNATQTEGDALNPPRRRRPGLRQIAIVAAAILGGTLAGASGVSYAAILTGSVHWNQGHRLAMIQRRVHAALDGVGATTVQEDKVHDILASGFTALAGDRDAHRTARKQLIDLLRAPTIDRAAVEKLRTDQVARFDARSKTVMGMLLDSADQLSPEQRAALAERAEAMMARGHDGWHKRGDGPDGDGHGGRDRGQTGGDGREAPPAPDGNPG